MKRIGRYRAFWWTLLTLSALGVLAMLWLIFFDGSGNWLTVIGSSGTAIVSILMLRSLRKGRNVEPEE